jgi:hypothetical protein
MGKGANIRGLWTKQEATDVHAFADSNTTVIWGCDMEEEQPQLMIRKLAALNPDDPDLSRTMELTKDGYDRSMAPHLLSLAEASKGKTDEMPNDGMMSLFVRTSSRLWKSKQTTLIFRKPKWSLRRSASG